MRGAVGAWTLGVLGAIAENPGLSSADLAPRFDRERRAFRIDVRKPKALGLTEGLELGSRPWAGPFRRGAPEREVIGLPARDEGLLPALFQQRGAWELLDTPRANCLFAMIWVKYRAGNGFLAPPFAISYST